MEPTLGPIDHRTGGMERAKLDGLKYQIWTFEVNPMPLTPLFVARKYNDFVLKKYFFFNPMV